MNALLSLLAQDSIKVAQLERIYAAHCLAPGLPADAMTAMRLLDSDLAWRAVWILKQLARERKLTEPHLIQLARCAGEMRHWASRLNLCQLFSMTGCPAAAREELYPYLVECFANRRVMIRAWAISAMIGFQADLAYRKPVAAMLRQAQADPGSSMKARLRLVGKEKAKQVAVATADSTDGRR